MSAQRYIYLLRPNVIRPDHHAPGNLDTPPATDLGTDYSSQFESESDRPDHETDSDVEPSYGPKLTAISETSSISTPVVGIAAAPPRDDEHWSVIDDTNSGAHHEHGASAALAHSISSLSVISEADAGENIFRR